MVAGPKAPAEGSSLARKHCNHARSLPEHPGAAWPRREGQETWVTWFLREQDDGRKRWTTPCAGDPELAASAASKGRLTGRTGARVGSTVPRSRTPRGLPRAGLTLVSLEASVHSRVDEREDLTSVESRRVAPACRALGLRRRRRPILRDGEASGRGTRWRGWLHRTLLPHFGSHLLRPSRVGRGRLRR